MAQTSTHGNRTLASGCVGQQTRPERCLPHEAGARRASRLPQQPRMHAPGCAIRHLHGAQQDAPPASGTSLVPPATMARPSRAAALCHALLVAFALEGAWGVQGPMRFDLDVDSRKGSWTLKLGGETWAESQALPRLHADGHWLSLQLSSSSATPPNASGTSITYKDTATGTEVLETSFELSHDGLQATFTQCVLTELSNTALSPLPKLAKDHVLSSFPSFATTGSGAKLARGFFAYHGQMVGGMEDGTFYGVWGRDGIPSDTSVGPIVVFAQDLGAGAVVFGPALNVMATTTAFNASANLLEFGLMGSITRVPAGTCSSTVAVAAATPTMAVKR